MQGKAALVTGGASGIGFATAGRFVAAGADVLLADRDAVQGAAALEELAGSPGRVAFFETDITDSAAVNAVVAKTIERFGRLDYAIHSAGITGPAHFTADLAESDWSHVLAVNLTAVWLCMKAEIPVMLNNGGGAIVNIASTAGLRGGKGTAAYSASKHGVLGLTKSAAAEYARQGIRINAVCPGATDTPMLARLTRGNERLRTRLAGANATGRYVMPEEIAATCLWLCSDAAASVIGQAIVVDGGTA
jgi:NAD(P)-dependent dehydrogenase (short-subunit alcohol dehydrogenase family)